MEVVFQLHALSSIVKILKRFLENEIVPVLRKNSQAKKIRRSEAVVFCVVVVPRLSTSRVGSLRENRCAALPAPLPEVGVIRCLCRELTCCTCTQENHLDRYAHYYPEIHTRFGDAVNLRPCVWIVSRIGKQRFT